MKIGRGIMFVGGIMFSLGIILFYSIESGQTDSVLRFVKNLGTFIGLSGIGVALAGILYYLINRNEIPLKENFDV